MSETPGICEQLLREFCARERGRIEAKGKGGQSVGYSPSISPSVLHDLEWMVRAGAEARVAEERAPKLQGPAGGAPEDAVEKSKESTGASASAPLTAARETQDEEPAGWIQVRAGHELARLVDLSNCCGVGF